MRGSGSIDYMRRLRSAINADRSRPRMLVSNYASVRRAAMQTRIRSRHSELRSQVPSWAVHGPDECRAAVRYQVSMART